MFFLKNENIINYMYWEKNLILILFYLVCIDDIYNFKLWFIFFKVCIDGMVVGIDGI